MAEPMGERNVYGLARSEVCASWGRVCLTADEYNQLRTALAAMVLTHDPATMNWGRRERRDEQELAMAAAKVALGDDPSVVLAQAVASALSDHAGALAGEPESVGP